MTRRIDYDKMPAEFQHLSKTEQAKLVYQAEDISKKLKKLPPELMDQFSRQATELGMQQAASGDFVALFNTVLKQIDDALEQDQSDRKAARRLAKENTPTKQSTKCRCDFLPDLPQYKKVTCKEANCCHK